MRTIVGTLSRTAAVVGLAAGIAFPFGCASNAGTGESVDSTSQGLTLERTGNGGFKGTFPAGTETVSVVAAVNPNQRVVDVLGRGGVSLAHWEITVNTGEIVGSLGGRSFGHFADRTTDMNPTYWQEVYGSSTGATVKGVSGTAEALAANKENADILDGLNDFGSMYTFLEEMTDPARAQIRDPEVQRAKETLGGVCARAYSAGHFVEPIVTGGDCLVLHYAYSDVATSPGCGAWACVEYLTTGGVVVKEGCAYDSEMLTYDQYEPLHTLGGMWSKHWTGLAPTPMWFWATGECD